MRLEPRFLNWGVFFILLGVIPLGVEQGWIAADAVSGWWRYWPLILIGIGVGLLLRRTAAHFLGGLIVAATFGLMLGGLLAVGVGGRLDFACTPGRSGTSFTPQGGVLAGRAQVGLEMTCGDLKVTSAAGDGWSLSGTSSDGRAPRVEAAPSRLSISSHARSGVGWIGTGGPAESWELVVPADGALDLGTTLNAGSARLDLGSAKVASLSMTTNAGSIVADLGGTPLSTFSATVNAGSDRLTLPLADLSGSITVNAGSFQFCVPSAAGVRISASDSFLGSNNFEQAGLTRSGSTWTSPNYASATVRIELSATTNLGSIQLDPEGGCK